LAVLQTFVAVDSSVHHLKAFDCGKSKMNNYLARYAEKNQKLGLSATWVLPVIESDQNLKAKIACYYSLASTTVTRAQIPADKKLPGYPVPVVLLARLAVDKGYQKQGLGEKTLISALRQCVILTDKGLPAYGLILDILDDEALGFYQQFEIFKPFTNDPMRLFVGMNVLKKI
jgi:GNAT superfamily N-acetyltransferase